MKTLFPKMIGLAVLLSAFVIVLLPSCEEDELPPIVQKSTISFKVNGQQYTNTAISYESNLLGAMQMMSDTIINGDTLGGMIAIFPSNVQSTPKASFALSVSGSTTGTFNWPLESQIILSFSYAGDSTKYISATDTTFASKTIVTSYDNVGQKISGTFSGICVSADTTLRTINLTNGQFDLVRKK
ncbi:MAG: hypothetical protein PHT69_01725 [Bacteroidales bacterium]|nr:hypothetical protein [Bacteroidales bacterium]